MKYLYLEQNKKTLKMTVGTEMGELSYTHKYQTYSSSDESCSEDDYIKNMLKEASNNDKKRRRSKKIKY